METYADDDIRMAEHTDCALCAAGEGMAHYPEPETVGYDAELAERAAIQADAENERDGWRD